MKSSAEPLTKKTMNNLDKQYTGIIDLNQI